MSVRLPGICIVCRRSVVWTGKSWRNPGQWGGRHVCPQDRPKCGSWMPYAKERCARRPGHTTSCRSQAAMDHQYYLHTGRRRAAA